MARLATFLALFASLQPGSVVFDDMALERLLRESPRFVVCIWSPHMPLSIDAVHQIGEAGRLLGVRVIVVLDPRADREYAAGAAGEARLPSDAVRAAHAVKLMEADAFQHSPAIVAFADGRQAGPPIFGYRAAFDYEKVLRERFGRIR